MVFDATFNNISVISWSPVLLVEEYGVPGENHRPVAGHWQTLSHNVVWSICKTFVKITCSNRSPIDSEQYVYPNEIWHGQVSMYFFIYSQVCHRFHGLMELWCLIWSDFKFIQAADFITYITFSENLSSLVWWKVWLDVCRSILLRFQEM